MNRTNRILTKKFKSDPYGVKRNGEHKDLNGAELEIATHIPIVVRVPSQLKPTLLSKQITYNHNPDFMMYHWYIEVKGHIFKPGWVKLLNKLERPDRYKVVLCSRSRASRKRLRNALDKYAPEIGYTDIENKEVWKAWAKEAREDWNNSTAQERDFTRQLFGRLCDELPPVWLDEGLTGLTDAT